MKTLFLRSVADFAKNSQFRIAQIKVQSNLKFSSTHDSLSPSSSLTFAISGLSMAGKLELNPKLTSVTKLAGDDKSFFMSCIPFSSIGPVGDSRIRAKELSWKKKQKPPIGTNWVTLGSQQHLR